MKDANAALLPYQRRLLDAVAKHDVVVVEKSRRIGVTWALAADAALTAGQKGGMDVLYIGYNYEMTREFIAEAGRWAERFSIAAQAAEEVLLEDERAIKAFRINFASGRKALALSSCPRGLRGRQGKVIFDEAALHDDLPGILKSALALLIWGGKVIITSTHMGQDNPFNELVMDIRAGRKPYKLLRFTFADALKDGLYERTCIAAKRQPSAAGKAAWREEIYKQYGADAGEELDCVPAEGGGTFLSLTLIESCAVQAPVVRWAEDNAFAEVSPHLREAATRDWCSQHLTPLLEKMDAGAPTCFGVDFGRSGDLSVIWPLATEKDLKRTTPFIVELRNIPYEQQKQVLVFLGERLPRFRRGAMDATGNGAYLAEAAMQKFGSARIEQVKLSVDYYREHMPRLKAALEDNKLAVAADEDIVSDLRCLVMKDGVAQVPKNARRRGRDGRERHGDAAIAACLAWAASESGSPVMEFRSLPAVFGAGDVDARIQWDGGVGWVRSPLSLGLERNGYW